jgi:glycosyltransferase involved in cell wall biosynthesis
LTYWKGAELALRAVAACNRRVSLTVVGEGSQRRRLGRLVNTLEIGDRVTFTGKLTYEQVQAAYLDHDVFLFPSLQDSGGLAALEAMATGLPVVCLDLGGPGMAVTPPCGIAVTPTHPGAAVRDLARGLDVLGADPELRARMGDAARERVSQAYSWDEKGALVRALYLGCISDARVSVREQVSTGGPLD